MKECRVCDLTRESGRSLNNAAKCYRSICVQKPSEDKIISQQKRPVVMGVSVSVINGRIIRRRQDVVRQQLWELVLNEDNGFPRRTITLPSI